MFRHILLPVVAESGLTDETGAKREVLSERDATGPVIRHVAREKLVDLLVIARAARRARAYEIVREAPCPVLSV